MNIPFNTMTPVGNEEKYLVESLRSGRWCGRGPMTLALEKLAREKCGAKHAFFVTSCTSAMEVACLVANLKPGDEVIIPSFGFVSAANAVLLTGAKPVFADIDASTWNLSRATVEKCLTEKTKAVLSVHYAGSSAGVEDIRKLCLEKNFFFIEDAAQSFGAKRNGKPIGSTPWATCFSLHETKNVSCGEGGFIMTDSDDLAHKIEIVIEKGTNRQRFFRGQIDKYTWVERGGSYIASDLLAAVALAQMEKLDEITARRQQLEKKYKSELQKFSDKIQWQVLPANVETNGHIVAFTVAMEIRDKVLTELKASGVGAVFHYIPLHDAPYAQETGLAPDHVLPNSTHLSESLIRMPIYYSLTDSQLEEVLKITQEILVNNL